MTTSFVCPGCRLMVEVENAPDSGGPGCPACGAVTFRVAEDPGAVQPDAPATTMESLTARPRERAAFSAVCSVIAHGGAVGAVLLVGFLVGSGSGGTSMQPAVDDSEPAGQFGRMGLEPRRPEFQFRAEQGFAVPTLHEVGEGTPDGLRLPYSDAGQWTSRGRLRKATGASPIPGPVAGWDDGESAGELSPVDGWKEATSASNPWNFGGRGGGGNWSGFGSSSRCCGPPIGIGRGNLPGGGEIFGIGGLSQARRVVFVADRSLSMIHMTGRMKTTLARLVGRLQPHQEFNVVWFSDGEPGRFSSAGPVRADDDAKLRLVRHLTTIQCMGTTHPRAALTDALAQQPGLIVLVTDGAFDPRVAEEITAANTRGVPIECAAMTTRPAGLDNLCNFASANGGTVHLLPAEEPATASRPARGH